MRAGYIDHRADPAWLKNQVKAGRVYVGPGRVAGYRSDIDSKDAIITEGYINNVLLLAGGTGYTSNPTITIDLPETNILKASQFDVWDNGTATAPTGWTLTGSGATIARDSSKQQNGRFSLALTRSGTDCYISQTVSTIRGISYWDGRTVTFGAWVYATVANVAYVTITDGVNTVVSTAHTGNSTWQLLTVELTVDYAATALSVQCNVKTTNATVNFDNCAFMDQSMGHTQATAHAIVSGGVIQSIVVDERGSGYTVDFDTCRWNPFPTVTITDSTGSGASAICYVPIGWQMNPSMIHQATTYICRDRTIRGLGLATSGRIGIGAGLLNQVYPGTCSFEVPDTSYDNPDNPIVPIFAVGSNNGCHVVTSDGSLWYTGLNDCYQMGLSGDITQRTSFTRIPPSALGNKPVVKFKVRGQPDTGGAYCNMWAMVANTGGSAGTGTLYRWGYNGYGQLGQGNTTIRQTPLALTNPGGTQIMDFCDIAANYIAATALLEKSGYVWVSGDNAYGQLSQGDVTQRTSFVQALASAGTPLADVVLIRGGGGGTSTGYGNLYCLVSNGGTLYSAGYGVNGELGNNTILSTASGYFDTVKTGPGAPITKVYKVWVQTAGGSVGNAWCVKSDTEDLYCWGGNNNGNLGLGDITLRSVATPTLNSSRGTEQVRKVALAMGSSTFSTCVWLTNGRIYTAGLNGSGQLGDNTVTQRTSWVTPHYTFREIVDVNWIQQRTDSQGVLQCITRDGQAYCCGINSANVLGDGTVTARPVMQRVRM